MSEPDAEKNNQRITIIGIIVMVVAVAIILMSGGSDMITKPIIEARLKAFGEQVASDARLRGGDAVFSYDSVQIEGWFLSKKAVITNPSLIIKRSGHFRADEYTFTTPKAIGEADNMSGKNLDIRFPDPFTVSSAGKKIATVRFEGEPVYAFSRQASGYMNSLNLPPKLTIANEEKNAEGTQGTVEISYDAKPVISVLQQMDGTHVSNVNFRNIRFTDAHSKKERLSVGSLAVDMNEKMLENGRTGFDSVVSINDIGVKTQSGETGPYSLKFSAQGNAASQDVRGAGNEAAPLDMHMNVREASLVADNFQVQAKGTVERRPEDMLPFGSMDVSVEHFQKLLNSALVAPEAADMLRAIASAVTGSPADKTENLKFTIQREKLGTLMIGKVPFEQMIMFILTQKSHDSSSAIAAPVASPVLVPQSSTETAPPAVNSTGVPLPDVTAPQQP